jgi:NAD(P)-dependent dehydrogenase (short-subunit alcohol dehydrogenase family)
LDADRQRVVLVTGASSGIGKACAQFLHQKGYRVYGTSRHAPEQPPATPAESAGVSLIRMDVTSDDSVEQGVQWLQAREGRLDVVVNCAGDGIAGAVEDTDVDEARAQLETNFFGVVRVCHAVLPIMRQQGGGYLINVSSMAGLIGIPFQGFYSASKFAVEGYTEALRVEVNPYGIRVVLIEPGDFQTGFTANRRKTRSAQGDTVYSERFAKALAVMEADETHGPTPEKVGYLVERIITTPSPKLRHTVGPVSEKVAVMLKRLLPAGWFEWGLIKYYRLG